MFFIMSINSEEEKLDFYETAICPSCGGFGRAEVFCTFSHFTLFFIPLFAFSRRYYIKMSCCGAVCEMDKETGDAIRKGQITHIDLTRYGFKRIRRCPKCGYIPQDNDFDFCPKCGARL